MIVPASETASEIESTEALVERLAPLMAQRLMSIPTIWGDKSRVKLGAKVHLVNALLNVVCGSIDVGDYVFCGHNVCLLTGTHSITDFDAARQEGVPDNGRDIVIKRGVWLASNVTILGPCTIGEDAVIGAGSVVLGDVRDGWFYAGVPARPIRPVADKYRNTAADIATSQNAAATQSPASRRSLVPKASVELVDQSTCFSWRGALLTLSAECALGPVGETLLLPFDEVMFPIVLAHNGWAVETLEFLEQRIDPTRAYTVLDIGANVGLFTRQVALRFGKLKRFVCVEAELGNFRALQYNLLNLLGDRGNLWNVALSDTDGSTSFFVDEENFGNNSLNIDAMRKTTSYDAVTVQSVATDRWMRENIKLEEDDRIIWKSDTQGFDELIVSLMPLEIWDRVDFAMMELWRIKKPDFDQDAFYRRIDAFPNKAIGIGNNSTTVEVREYLQSDDWAFNDLFLWR